MKYVCDFLFAGNLSRFATAINVNYRHLYMALYVSSRPTANMLAQIVARTEVRAEWLLTGAGPMLVSDENRVETGFELPATVQSVFPVFDAAVPSVPAKQKKTRPARPVFASNSIGAAQALHSCRVAGKPACFFLGADAFAVARRSARMLFSRGYFTGAAVTAGCLPYEFTEEFDATFAARTAALHGVGLGEGLNRWAAGKQRQSLFAQPLSAKVPLTVHAEFGELPEHLQPVLRGAEIGAALGAALYVDYLVFAEQIRQFSDCRGGAVILLGEPQRGLRLVLSAVQAARAAFMAQPLTDFTVIQIGNTPDETKQQVKSHGGQFYYVAGAYAAAAKEFLQACDDVYDGKIPHDKK